MESNSPHEGVPVLATTIDLPKPMEKTELTSNTSETFASAFEKENNRIGFTQKKPMEKIELTSNTSETFASAFEKENNRIGFTQKKPMEKTELTSNTSETFASAFEKENNRIGFTQKKPMEKTELTCNKSETFASAFEKENHRIGFIQKLLCIKVLQALLVTAVMAGFVAGGFPVYKVMVVDTATRIHFIIVSTLVFVVVVTLIHYCTRARTKSPNSYIFLVVYPVSGGFFITVVLYGWALNSMLLSWVQFNCVLFALLLYSIWSFETKLEFDTTLGLCISAAIFIISYACTIPFIYDVNGFAVVCFSLMMFLTTTYVLYDIEEMVSEDYHASLTPADYFKAAVYMHVDHCYLVMKLYNKHRRASLNVYD